MARYEIDGSRIEGIGDFYAELNRLIMAGEDWRLGESLDALNDLLYGGIGALEGDSAPRFVWRDHQHSRAALGVEATGEWLRGKLGGPFNHDLIRSQLADLDAGTGRTYFELILDVFADHPAIVLDLR